MISHLASKGPGNDSQCAALLLDSVRNRLQHLNAKASERRMFGGVTFMHNGNMLCCVGRKGLMVRVGADNEAVALTMSWATPCMGAGRRMAGFVMVGHQALGEASNIERWLETALQFVAKLPPKQNSARNVQ